MKYRFSFSVFSIKLSKKEKPNKNCNVNMIEAASKMIKI